MNKDDLVTNLENKPMDWALRAWILHNHGYTNAGDHGNWHPGPGVSVWMPAAKKPTHRRKKVKKPL